MENYLSEVAVSPYRRGNIVLGEQASSIKQDD
jgi:hypothetical protein